MSRFKAPVLPESAVQRQIVDWARWQLRDSILASIPNGQAMSGVIRQQLGEERAKQVIGAIINAQKALGLLPGMSDLILMRPAGVFKLIEVKSKNGDLQESQKELHPRLEAIGHPVHIVRSLEEFIAVAGSP